MKISNIVLQQPAITKNPEYQLCLTALSCGIPIKLTHFLIRQIDGQLYWANAFNDIELDYSESISWEYLWNYTLKKITPEEIEAISSNLNLHNQRKNKSIFIWEFETTWFHEERERVNKLSAILAERKTQLSE